MLAHNMKEILTIVPEASGMVKKASLEEEFPVDSADSAAASYLRVHYLIKSAGRVIDPDVVLLVEKAASLYNVKPKLDEYVNRFSPKRMEKAASVESQEAVFEVNLVSNGFLNIEKAASEADRLFEQFGNTISSPEVKRYSGQAWLNKEAAVKALGNRFYATKDVGFVKLAREVVDSFKENDFTRISKLCKDITSMDKKAGLDIIGFNFYKEALMTKEADYKNSVCINLAGKSIPYEHLLKFGKDRIGSALGTDISESLNGDPVNDKAVLESLPRDLQIMLSKIMAGSGLK